MRLLLSTLFLTIAANSYGYTRLINIEKELAAAKFIGEVVFLGYDSALNKNSIEVNYWSAEKNNILRFDVRNYSPWLRYIPRPSLLPGANTISRFLALSR